MPPECVRRSCSTLLSCAVDLSSSLSSFLSGGVGVVELFSSDGNVVSNNFVALTDNKHLEGADYIVPVIRRSVATPGGSKIINSIDPKLTTNAISKLNIKVGINKEEPATVAQAWVKIGYRLTHPPSLSP